MKEPAKGGIANRRPTLTVKTKLQNQLIWMICAALAIPTVILGGALYLITTRISSLANGQSAQEIVMEVMRFVGVLFPLASGLLLHWVFSATNRIVGPIERITRELESRIEGKGHGPIVLRPGDELAPLANGINTLIAEREQPRQP